MNLTYTRPGELRKPDVEVLPDNRIRITRYIAAGHGDRDYSEVTEAVGTADQGLATALLVRKGMAQVNGKDAIVKTYEVRNASTETLVGLPDIQYSESGQKTMIYDYIQMSSGTYTPGTIGTTTAPGDATCVLRTEQVEDDGTTRQIRRTFINKGLLQQSDETRNNGALLLKTFVYLNDAPVPNPPTGYTLVNQRTENPNGLETTTYTYAKGNGEISRETRYVQSTDQGTTGATVITVRHLTASSVTTNPIATPSGTVLISEEKSDQDGYRVWTATYAKGAGTVSSSTDTREGGKLVIYRKAALGTVPTAPTATIGGTVTLISDTSRNESGYVIYERTWAEGVGEVSRDTRYVQSSDQGTTGATVITVRYLTANSVTTNPITTPVGTVLISEQKDDQDGYRIWNAVYAKGTGTVSSSTDTRDGGKLIIYRKTALGTAPTAPSATISGTVTLISDTSRNDSGYVVYERTWAEGVGEISRDTRYSQSTDQGTTGVTVITVRHLTAASVTTNPITTPAGTVLVTEEKADQDGYRVWTATYAKGTGTVSSSTETREGGKLVIYRKTAIGAAPSAPSPTIAGTVTLISDTSRNDSGYVVYERTWAEGIGEIARDTRYSQSNDQGTTGTTVITVRYVTALSVTTNPITTPAGTVLISESKDDQDGYRAWSAVYAKGTGQVVTDVDIRNGGKLKVYHRVSLGAAPTTPTATIGGTVNVVTQNVRKDSGFDIYDYVWAEGIGIVSERIQYRDGGLRLFNRDIFLAQGATDYSTYTPTYGIEVDKSFTEGEGIRRYSVTWIQSNSGGDPLTVPVLQFTSKVPFTYPGRARAYYAPFTVGSYTSHKAYDVFMSPPVQALIDATTIVYYKATNTTPTPTAGYTLWNPTEWATMYAKWIGWSNSPRSSVKGLTGYIKVGTGLSGTTGGSGTDTSVLGDRVYASTDWSITLSGGPSDPSSTNLTLNIDQVPAFTKTDGTQYYRVTEVYATVPAYPALPVTLLP